MNYKLLMGILLPSVLFSLCLGNNEKSAVSGSSPQLAIKTPPLRPEEAVVAGISEMCLPQQDSRFHGFSPNPRRVRATSDGSAATVLAGLVRRPTFGSAESLQEHPFSPCKRSVSSFGSLSEHHPVTPEIK